MGASTDPCGMPEVKTFPFQDHFLCATAEKAFHPFQHHPSHTVVMEFGCQMVVGHFVKCSLNELCLTGSTFTEPMLMSDRML